MKKIISQTFIGLAGGCAFETAHAYKEDMGLLIYIAGISITFILITVGNLLDRPQADHQVGNIPRKG